MNISAIILTKNEEENIAECIASLSWCDEILVIDDLSTDRTVARAKKLGAKVFERTLEDNFSKQRNFGLAKASGDWVLFVDADERVDDPLRGEIQQVIERPQGIRGYVIKRDDIMWGKRLLHGETGSTWLLRLARKDAGEWKGSVHEVWDVQGRVRRLMHPLVHYPHPSLRDFLKEINLYSTIRAKELFENNVKVNSIEVILYPKIKLVQNYVFRLGFLDGIPGLLIALLMSLHSFLVRGKLWQLWQQS